jgi:hypothetical protein
VQSALVSMPLPFERQKRLTEGGVLLWSDATQTSDAGTGAVAADGTAAASAGIELVGMERKRGGARKVVLRVGSGCYALEAA